MEHTLDSFKTPVLKEKQTDFIELLNEQGIDSTAIINNGLRGDYYLYQIDLSSLDDEHYSIVKNILISNQTSFL